MNPSDHPLHAETLLAEARNRAGLDDFGSSWFLEPLGVMLNALRTEARLSEAGVAAHRERILAGLVNRLRTTDAVKRHPEILQENVQVAGVIVGLPRTGSTMFHRLLTTAPGLTALRWWEAQNYAPFPGEERGRPVERVAFAERLLASMLEHNPDLMSIHPFQVHGADEEIIILDQFFIGTMPEAYAYIPSYSAWLKRADQRPAYEELRTVLKFLQWQDPERAGKRWVTKTPGHLAALDALLAVFPEAQLIMTHRDPLHTAPSYCSMVVALHELSAAQLDRVEVGRFTARRWAEMLERFTHLRDEVGESRFIDVAYQDLVKDPLGQWRRVLQRLGEPVTPAAERAAEQWLRENGREKRGAHHYTLDEFGLTRSALEEWFAAYRTRFIQPSESV
ncbi:MAG TPA: sulfotransferase [Steroidobacter sp.]|nr:sulfotransferase [Steroidobacteraceae bacterium]HLS82994.1 sulfotransferase [Steroidobacter sp.]